MKYFNPGVKYQFINPDTQTLLMIEPETSLNIFEWVKENKSFLEEYLIKHNGVLLRNFGIYSVSEFNKIVQIICPNLLDYVYRSTPRTKLGDKIYTATEYPADKTIPLHNENSYTKSWPKKIFFFSIIVATEGGETPIASSRNVYKKIDLSIKEKFEKNGIMYVRNYTPGIDLSWQNVFQTEEKEQVNKFCKDNDIQIQWNNSGPELTTRQVCQATIKHPIINKPVWFNQAHLFHISALEESNRFSLIKELGENNIPRNAFYGDGSPIEIEVLRHIRKVYNEERIKFKWHKGDIMILDNVLTAHAREPFKGERKVVVAMA
ncbi:taurine catabolism dioxygenase TauD/TfdA [Candidatus Megaera polyxenophila]|nr:taurine catabolism dioxygenase TauD/TfdA [Candidatus Megaera polyxenophila]